MPDNIVRFLGTAWDASSTAGEIIRSSWQQPQTIAYKGAIDLVTSHKECEEKIVGTIRRDFPDHSILAEEATQIEGAQRGGTLSDFSGAPFSIWADETLASNSIIHNEMVRVTSETARTHVDCIRTG